MLGEHIIAEKRVQYLRLSIFLQNFARCELSSKKNPPTMTDQELRNLVAQLALDTQAFKQQLAASQEAADIRAAEADKRAAEAKAEADKRAAEADKRAEKAAAETAEMKRYMKELGKQIGGIHEKFGKFTEGLMLPSLQRIVRKNFGAEALDINVARKIGDRHIEIDALAVANGERNVCVVIEVKSNLNQQELDKMLKKMRDVQEFFPEHRQKKLYGIVAVVHATQGMEERVYEAGLYLARMTAKTFRLDVPKGFVPKAF
ncbi:MAG: DUF3782 domain-containing protein [Candidatus Kapaibacterium sp.]|nr:MAG: DUF3782 domain-containing protein [Candidatus Kapabacteria bacterium]